MDSIAKHAKPSPVFNCQLPQWYVAKIVFNIVTGVERDHSQFDEQLRLVEAESKEEAYLKARAIGIGEEEILVNDENKFMKWEFVDVADLHPLPALNSGVEIYSRIHETNESRQYIHSIHQRGMTLRMNIDQTNT